MYMGGLGLHDLVQWRPALLARHAWRFFDKPNSLLSRCIRARYGENLAEVEFGRSASPTWHLICDGFGALRECMTWQVVNGQKVDFWADRWINGRSIARWPTFVNCLEDGPRLVAEFMHGDDSWNLQLLRRFCGEDLVYTIVSCPRRRDGDHDYASLPGLLGGNSVSAIIGKHNQDDITWEFDWVAKLKVRPREKVFWWRVCKEAVPCMAWLVHRGMARDVRCPWGCGSREDRKHIVAECQFLLETIRCIQRWGIRMLPLGSEQSIFNELRRATRSSKAEFGTLAYCYAVYHCWRNRLKLLHGEDVETPTMIAAKVLGGMTVILDPSRRSWGATASIGFHQNLWRPPPLGWIKINIDGSLLDNGRGGCAAVLRNHHGDFIGAVGRQMQHWDSAMVELQCIMLLKECKEMWMDRFRGIIIEGDHAGVMELLQGELERLRMGLAPHRDVDLSFLVDCGSIIFLHVSRNGNMLADFAAKYARGACFCWGSAESAPPQFCELFLREKNLIN